MKQNKTITVLDAEQYDTDYPPAPLKEFMVWLNTAIIKVPEENRDSVMVDIGSVHGYEGETYGHVEIRYKRLETDEEESQREADEKQKQNKLEEKERATFEALKAKFETKP